MSLAILRRGRPEAVLFDLVERVGEPSIKDVSPMRTFFTCGPLAAAAAFLLGGISAEGA